MSRNRAPYLKPTVLESLSFVVIMVGFVAVVGGQAFEANVHNVRPAHGVIEHVERALDDEILITLKSGTDTTYTCKYSLYEVCKSFRPGDQFGDPTIVALTIE